MSSEIPGQVSEREIVEANYAVIAERDELRQQLAASQAREAELREACDLLRVVALPPVGVSGHVAVNSSSDISSDEEREWAELEKLGPRGADLIKFAKLNLPPQEWYDEVELRAWKESAIAVTPPLQEIAKELGVPLGESIHDKILPGVKLLKAKIAVLRQCVELYAEEKNWLPADTAVRTRRLFNLIGSGYESAQAALAMVEGMK